MAVAVARLRGCAVARLRGGLPGRPVARSPGGGTGRPSMSDTTTAHIEQAPFTTTYA